MLAARQLLKLIESMLGELSQWGKSAVPEATVHAQYVAIVCMLRSVGYVLRNTDCVSEEDQRFLAERWPIWKLEDVFASFIEPARNELLKEFGSRLKLDGYDDDISHAAYATPGMGTGVTRVVFFDPTKLRDTHGRLVFSLFQQAIRFWDRHLNEIEAAQSA